MTLSYLVQMLRVSLKCHLTKSCQNTPEELGANGLMFGRLAMLEESGPGPDNCNSGCR